jgi:hypothetical protein
MNLRRPPLPVDYAPAPCVLPRAVLTLLIFTCLAAGGALGALAVAGLNLLLLPR